MRGRRLLSLVLVVAIGVYFGLSGAVVAEDEIKIGAVVPLTGAVAVYGNAVYDAFRLAVEEINAAGGINGKKVVLIAEDNKSDTVETVNIVNKLVHRDRVSAVLGPVISSTSSVAASILQRERVPMVTPTATAVEVTRYGDYIFRVCFLDSFQGKVMAEYAAKELGAKTAAILYDSANDYSVGLKDVFKKWFEESGGKVVAVSAYTGGDTDFNTHLTKFKKEDPDVVYLPAYYNDDVLILRQARQLGLDSTFLGADGWDAPELLEGAGKQAEGSHLTTHYTPTDPSPQVQNFLKAYRERYGKDPIVLAALGYDAAKLLFEALERADSTDRREIQRALAATDGFLGVTGAISFDENGDPIKDITILKIEDGEFKFVAKRKP